MDLPKQTNPIQKNLLRNVVIVVILISLLVPIFYLGTTGYLTTDRLKLEGELAESIKTKDECITNLVNCMSNFTSSMEQLASAHSKISELEENVGKCSIDLKSLAKNFAKEVCCRPGIEITNFNVTENNIICTGPYTMDCKTGETNY